MPPLTDCLFVLIALVCNIAFVQSRLQSTYAMTGRDIFQISWLLQSLYWPARNWSNLKSWWLLKSKHSSVTVLQFKSIVVGGVGWSRRSDRRYISDCEVWKTVLAMGFWSKFFVYFIVHTVPQRWQRAFLKTVLYVPISISSCSVSWNGKH